MENLMTLISFLLVPAIDLINSNFKNSQVRFWISAGVCLIVGVLVSFLKHSGFQSVDAVSADILGIFAMVQLIYKGMYEGSDTQKAIREGGPAEK
jgi:hypothetical protein